MGRGAVEMEVSGGVCGGGGDGDGEVAEKERTYSINSSGQNTTHFLFPSN